MRFNVRGALVGAVLAAVLASGSASAATPTQIYKDYADNGRLDGTYSRAELNAALKDVVLQGYGNPNVSSGLAPAASAPTGIAATSSGGTLPFTGTDLALMVLGGGVLVILGFALRRLGRKPAAMP